MIGLGLETGTWYLTKRNLQAAADAGAIAGAYESSANDRTTSASREVARNGFGNGSNVTITVNNPPSSGNYTADSNAVEVILSQPQNMMFAQLFLGQAASIKARAVATRQTVGDACVLALDSAATDTGTLDFTGNTTVNMPGCMIAANSTNSQSIDVAGHSTVDTQGLYTPGDYTTSGSGTLNTTTTPITGAAPLTDPYSNLSIPSYSGCNQTSYSVQGTATLSPGVYCNGLSINAHANVTLNPGVYIINQGSLGINGQATVSGAGVTIILTGSGSNYATVSINGGATVNLNAPTSGTYSGITFYQDRNAPLDSANNFNGGAGMNINGVMYFPKGSTTFNGGASNNTPCTQIVAWDITFSGNSNTNIASNCANSGMTPITLPGSVKLEE